MRIGRSGDEGYHGAPTPRRRQAAAGAVRAVRLCYHCRFRADRESGRPRRRPPRSANIQTDSAMAQPPAFDLADLKRRMQGAIQTLRHELGGLRTGRASVSLLEPVHVEAYGQRTPLNQVATISVPEPRALSVQVWDKSMVAVVDKAIRDANLGLSPTVEGQILRIRIPELNEQRRKEMVKVAHKYSEEARVAVRHVRRDGFDVLKRRLKDHAISEDDAKRDEAEVQKATDQAIRDIDQALASKEKEIMQV
jgi:ribosome recycling factor